MLFRLQKYKKFESNSQQKPIRRLSWDVVSTAKVQKIWEQFTTRSCLLKRESQLFRLQKYKKFESNSQLHVPTVGKVLCCFDCKSTKNLRAIHNNLEIQQAGFVVVSTAKVQKIWEQFTTDLVIIKLLQKLFRLQKYKKFESNSQLYFSSWQI